MPKEKEFVAMKSDNNKLSNEEISSFFVVMNQTEEDIDVQKQMASAHLVGVTDWNSPGYLSMPKKTGYKADADYIREMSEEGILNEVLAEGLSEKEHLDKTRSAIDELYEWVEKAVGPTEMAAAKQKGLVPQSGDWQAPGRWVKPKQQAQETKPSVPKSKLKQVASKGSSTHDKIINSSPEVASLFAKARDYVWNFDHELSDSFADREDDTDEFLRRFGFQDRAGDYGTESAASTVRGVLTGWTDGHSTDYMQVRGALHKLMGEGEDRTAKELQFWTETVGGVRQRFFDLYYGSSGDPSFHKKLIPFVAKSREYLRRKFPSGNITVYRGVSGKIVAQIQQSIEETGKADIPHDGISSYSLARVVAEDFASPGRAGDYGFGDSDDEYSATGVILQKTVPIDSVLLYFDIFNHDFTEEEVLIDSDFVTSFTKEEVEFYD